ncbi:MAG: hypothetical protein V2J20_08020 [Wenzhouxiangella sp.]|jgi:hypothetical protein|nr:hypothetical protein [Wenzhouxiangella sp.]
MHFPQNWRLPKLAIDDIGFFPALQAFFSVQENFRDLSYPWNLEKPVFVSVSKSVPDLPTRPESTES